MSDERIEGNPFEEFGGVDPCCWLPAQAEMYANGTFAHKEGNELVLWGDGFTHRLKRIENGGPWHYVERKLHTNGAAIPVMDPANVERIPELEDKRFIVGHDPATGDDSSCTILFERTENGYREVTRSFDVDSMIAGELEKAMSTIEIAEAELVKLAHEVATDDAGMNIRRNIGPSDIVDRLHLIARDLRKP